MLKLMSPNQRLKRFVSTLPPSPGNIPKAKMTMEKIKLIMTNFGRGDNRPSAIKNAMEMRPRVEIESPKFQRVGSGFVEACLFNPRNNIDVVTPKPNPRAPLKKPKSKLVSWVVANSEKAIATAIMVMPHNSSFRWKKARIANNRYAKNSAEIDQDGTFIPCVMPKTGVLFTMKSVFPKSTRMVCKEVSVDRLFGNKKNAIVRNVP